jgi:geranylgeranyl pyrophosphate synthase
VAGSDTLQYFIDTARARIEHALEAWLPIPPSCPPLLSAALRYSVMAGGKRLRPLLTLTAADAVARGAGTTVGDLALPAACALEYIHTYSLIHDDLPAMDNDTLRRGRPTLHMVYGNAVAILAGDALQAEAFALLAREPASADGTIAARKIAAIACVADAAGAAGMVGGQTIDIQAAGQVPGHPLILDAGSLAGMHARKTGALIRAAAASGAIMAGADATTVEAVSAWATHVGLAFQIVDDILDVEGDAAQLGKTAGKDAASDKPTYPSLFGLDRSRAMAAECAGRAHQQLAEARLTTGWLDAMADWVLTRKN